MMKTALISTIESAGDWPMKGAYEAQQVPADDRRQRALTGERRWLRARRPVICRHDRGGHGTRTAAPSNLPARRSASA